jgi:hypothetical protein
VGCSCQSPLRQASRLHPKRRQRLATLRLSYRPGPAPKTDRYQLDLPGTLIHGATGVTAAAPLDWRLSHENGGTSSTCCEKSKCDRLLYTAHVSRDTYPETQALSNQSHGMAAHLPFSEMAVVKAIRSAGGKSDDPPSLRTNVQNDPSP